ncbi:MAG: hypothetical protein KKC51_13900 [Verrucomicrobia bacterium]|nr:hypothetical protein [Verrucomicrobiota bacterium]
MDAKDPVAQWRVGDSWDIAVTLYSRDWMLSFSDPKLEKAKEESKSIATYAVRVTVAGVESNQDVSCVLLDFAADDNAPRGIRGTRFRLWVSQEDGSVRRVAQTEGQPMGSPSVERVGVATLLADAPYGYPLEVFPNSIFNEGRRVQLGDTSLSVATREELSDGREKLVFSTQKGEETMLSVEQRWADGARWWSQYSKFRQGHMEMEAAASFK